MNILDIHTHRFYEDPSESILNCFPNDFVPFADRFYSVGFHPWYLSGEGSEDWAKFEEQASLPQVLAIGEAGLDKLSEVDMKIQQKAFERQAEVASRLRKPLIIHCVKAYNEIIRYHIDMKPDVAWIIHGFRGKKELAAQLIDHGFYLSFGERYQEDAFAQTPADRIFMETDESTVDIGELYKKAAHLKSLTTDGLIEQIQQNIRRVFPVGSGR